MKRKKPSDQHSIGTLVKWMSRRRAVVVDNNGQFQLTDVEQEHIGKIIEKIPPGHQPTSPTANFNDVFGRQTSYVVHEFAPQSPKLWLGGKQLSPRQVRGQNSARVA